jgi:hypothetical protein
VAVVQAPADQDLAQMAHLTPEVEVEALAGKPFDQVVLEDQE